MSPTEADLAAERAIAAEEKKTTHDPRIWRMYTRDKWTIYLFVIMMWVVLWGVFFWVALPELEDPALTVFLIALGLFASIFNTVGMVQNTRRLKHEALRFYSQDIFWQDQRAAVKAEVAELKRTERQRRAARRSGGTNG